MSKALIENFVSKICRVCNLNLPLTNDYYSKDKNNKTGFSNRCKKCTNKSRMSYYYENLDLHREKTKKYRNSNSEKLKTKKKEYYQKIKIENRAKNALNIKRKRQENILFKLKDNIACLIRISLKKNGFTKNSRAAQILGCSFEEFKKYIEQQFESWMTWENYGKYNGEFNFGWNYDHIIPISQAKTEEEVIKLNHYTNFQPLCSKINRDIKKNKLCYMNNFAQQTLFD